MSVHMGDVVSQDRAYTIKIVHAIIGLYKSQFQAEGYQMPVHDMEAAMFFIATCLGGFQGYKTVWTDHGALRYDLVYHEECMMTIPL